MGLSERYQYRISLGHRNNALVLLLAINMIMFVGLAFFKAIFYLRYNAAGGEALVAQHFQDDILYWVVLPADFSSFLSRPWTLITHAFVHEGLLHLFGNMIWLWSFGYLLQDLTGNRKLFPVYIYGALAGALAFMLAYNFLPALIPARENAVALGASAGIMAIALAVTTIAPGFRIFQMINGGIPIWIITVIYLVIDLALIPVSNPGGHIAHLAGALAGFLFIFFLRKGYDWSDWMNNFFDWFNNLFNPDKPKKGKSFKEELFYKTTAQPYTKTPNVTQQRIDDILDKINQKGYSHLTEEEKELLKRASQEEGL